MNNYVVVIMMGGARVVYENAMFSCEGEWLKVLGSSRTTVAAYPAHRVSRVYYTHERRDGQGDAVIESVGL